MTALAYLNSYLQPFEPWLADGDVTDILVNRPNEVWVESRAGGMKRLAVEGLDPTHLRRLAQQIAAASHQAISREHPIISASLRNGVRVQIIGEPATRGGTLIAFRKHDLSDYSLRDLAENGLFKCALDSAEDGKDRLRSLLDQGKITEFLHSAVNARMTIVISGGTGSGKTTLMNALLKEVPRHERLIAIEDASELRIDHPNSIGLLAVRGGQGETLVDTEALLQATLRMRPDRIILGEIRGTEAFSFLRAVNTGHPGSITTVHADSCEGAIDQLTMLASMQASSMSYKSISSYIRNVIDVIVQINRNSNGRFISNIMLL